MSQKRIRIYDLVDLAPGHLLVLNFRFALWGSQLTLDCLYSHPPLKKMFQLKFEGCRGIQWHVRKSQAEMAESPTAQLLTHDLGLADYERPARFSMTTAELIVTYQTMQLLKEW